MKNWKSHLGVRVERNGTLQSYTNYKHGDIVLYTDSRMKAAHVHKVTGLFGLILSVNTAQK